MKHFRMLAAGLCSAVLLCGFAIPAYAYSDGGNEEPPVVEETPAPEPAPTITPGEGFSEEQSDIKVLPLQRFRQKYPFWQSFCWSTNIVLT